MRGRAWFRIGSTYDELPKVRTFALHGKWVVLDKGQGLDDKGLFNTESCCTANVMVLTSYL